MHRYIKRMVFSTYKPITRRHSSTMETKTPIRKVMTKLSMKRFEKNNYFGFYFHP